MSIESSVLGVWVIYGKRQNVPEFSKFNSVQR